MSQRLPTVRVINPRAPDSWMIINESDLKPEHTLWNAHAPASAPVSPSDLSVAKGPRGRWYVMRQGERLSTGFLDEAEADAEMHRFVEEQVP